MTRNMGKLDQLIDEGAYLERQVFTSNVECVQLGVPERILRKNGAQESLNMGSSNIVRGSGARPIRHRRRAQPPTLIDPKRRTTRAGISRLAVWACEVPRLSIADHYASCWARSSETVEHRSASNSLEAAMTNGTVAGDGQSARPEAGLTWRDIARSYPSSMRSTNRSFERKVHYDLRIALPVGTTISTPAGSRPGRSGHSQRTARHAAHRPDCRLCFLDFLENDLAALEEQLPDSVRLRLRSGCYLS